jgi:membrane protein DedA with SNARE-associated domain
VEELLHHLTNFDAGAIYLWLTGINPVVVYVLVFSLAFIENIFPPSPSDLMIVAGGSLIGLQRVGFAETLLCATAGSTLGFMAMYVIGNWFGERIVEQGKLRFLPRDGLHKVEAWFQRYGYWVVVINRFLTGTRAVVSFFAGMSELNLLRTTILCGVSALLWNAILVTGGWYLGRNWDRIGFFLSTYSQIVTGIVVFVIVVVVVRVIHLRRTTKSRGAREAAAGVHPTRHPSSKRRRSPSGRRPAQ